MSTSLIRIELLNGNLPGVRVEFDKTNHDALREFFSWLQDLQWERFALHFSGYFIVLDKSEVELFILTWQLASDFLDE